MKKKRWQIIFEDDDIIVIDKPAPYLTIPDRYDKTKPNLVSALSEKREDVFINHRLDKETSGLIVFTKNEAAHKHLSQQFMDRSVDKHYLTLVNRKPVEEVGLIDLAISPSGVRNKGMILDATGKETLTKYRILESWNRYSLLEVKLLTGRQHQIRVHMKAIRCPIVCDPMYGDGKPFMLSDIKRRINRDRETEERPLLSRVALHSSMLRFDHPTTGERLTYESPLPKDMKAVVHQLGKIK
jgi:23S rRNA pseudouridine955/2504/2580 synthase/23S rRNA pseudouridine1911/1915/1917 synthase